MLSSILSVGKNEKNSLSYLSHHVRKPFSANETFNAELLMKHFKLSPLCCPVASFVRLTSGFKGVVYTRDWTGQKTGGRAGGDKREKKRPLSFLYRTDTELLD